MFQCPFHVSVQIQGSDVRSSDDVIALKGAKGGDSSVTHQDLDHGTFVWETRGHRWIVDLGIENYGLTNMFLPFARYATSK